MSAPPELLNPKTAPPFLALPEERQRHILDRLARDGRVLAADLAREFGISEDTIRRDLRDLAAAGRCKRVYGGALPLGAAADLAARRTQAPVAKSLLARRAAALVRPDQILLIDAGSTNLAIAAALPVDYRLTVITNMPALAAGLTGRTDITVLLLGGRLCHATGASQGATTLRALQDIHADLCFLGSCSVHAEFGLGTFDAEEATVKRAMIETSGATVVAATTAKLGAMAPYTLAPLAALDQLVVEADAPAERLAPLRARGVTIVTAAAS